MRIVKYRGSTHGTNEYPFLIDGTGISVLPVTSLKLDYKSSLEIVSTGLSELDSTFTTGGIYRASSILLTGNSGTSKTIFAGHFAMSSCTRKEPTLYFSFEESPDQLVRNMATIGINFKEAIQSKLLYIHASRPSLQGLEMHLLVLNRLLAELKPRTVIIDPISSLISIGNRSEVGAMLVRLMDTLKIHQINALFTSLTHDGYAQYRNSTVDLVSSLADTCINLKNEERNNVRVRSLLIVKSRGMGHSNNEQDFKITNKGIQLLNTSKK